MGLNITEAKSHCFFRGEVGPKLFLRLILELPQTGQERRRDEVKGS